MEYYFCNFSVDLNFFQNEKLKQNQRRGGGEEEGERVGPSHRLSSEILSWPLMMFTSSMLPFKSIEMKQWAEEKAHSPFSCEFGKLCV